MQVVQASTKLTSAVGCEKEIEGKINKEKGTIGAHYLVLWSKIIYKLRSHANSNSNNSFFFRYDRRITKFCCFDFKKEILNMIYSRLSDLLRWMSRPNKKLESFEIRSTLLFQLLLAKPNHCSLRNSAILNNRKTILSILW